MSGDNVVPMRGLVMYQDEDPAITLEKAKAWGCKRVMILGEDEHGKLVWGGSFSDTQVMNWMLDLCKYGIIHTQASGE